MKNSSNQNAVVLVAAALVVGGLVAWLTQSDEPAIPSNQETRTAAQSVTDGSENMLAAAEAPVELAGSVVDYNRARWGEQGEELLAAPDRTPEGRPYYRSKAVFVSVDRNGNPVVTRPSYSPLEPSKLNKLDSKPIDRDQIGSQSGPMVNLNDPAVRQHLEESRARSQKAALLTKWANEQVEKGNINEDGLPTLPEDEAEMQALLDKLEKADAPATPKGSKKGKKNGGAGQGQQPGAGQGAGKGNGQGG